MMFLLFCEQKTAYEMRISDWSSDVCSSDLAARLTLGPGPAGVVDDHAAQESVVAGPAQADAQVAAVGPAGGQEAHARAAGRAPELQLAAHAFEALDDRAAVLRLGSAARLLIDDPLVVPHFVPPEGSAIRARANGARFVFYHHYQRRLGPRRGAHGVGARDA